MFPVEGAGWPSGPDDRFSNDPALTIASLSRRMRWLGENYDALSLLPVTFRTKA